MSLSTTWDCKVCNEKQEIYLPASKTLTKKGYWDRRLMCKCGVESFVLIYPDGKTASTQIHDKL